VFVLLAWRKVYGRWPKAWESVCIFLHDIGHWGKDYLDDLEQKREHWRLGARIGQAFFGPKAYRLLAGHCGASGFARSELYKADKYSWMLAPYWWLWLNTIFEPKLQMKYETRREAIKRFQRQVKKNIESGEYRDTHELYLERCVTRDEAENA